MTSTKYYKKENILILLISSDAGKRVNSLYLMYEASMNLMPVRQHDNGIEKADQSREQNWESRNKHLYLWSADFQQRCLGNSVWKCMGFSTNGTLATAYPHGERWIYTLISHHKNELRMDFNLSDRAKTM